MINNSIVKCFYAGSANASCKRIHHLHFSNSANPYTPAPMEEGNHKRSKEDGDSMSHTGIRETIIRWFAFMAPINCIPTDTAWYSDSSNWIIAGNPKNIAIARIISNG